MLVEEMKDLWICSCGNWVARGLTWCPECCEDRDFQNPADEDAQDLGQQTMA
jgi:hypothetical protein